jgi:hypothetical protein
VCFISEGRSKDLRQNFPFGTTTTTQRYYYYRISWFIVNNNKPSDDRRRHWFNLFVRVIFPFSARVYQPIASHTGQKKKQAHTV